MRRSTALAISVITIASGSGLASLARLSAHGQSTPAPMNSAVHGGDLTGVWTADPSRLPERVRGAWVWAFDPELPPMTAWAKERFAETKPTFGPKNFAVAETNDPVYQCYPPGTPRIYFHPFPMEIIQTPGRVLILYEYDHFIRQIFTDGRAHRDDLPSSWLGDSIGRWEGATLVVETVNFNDKTWIDRRGVPHSDQLKVIERFTRMDDKGLRVEITIQDPVAFTQSWTAERFFALTDWNIIEMVCMDNANFLEFEQEVLRHNSTETPKEK